MSNPSIQERRLAAMARGTSILCDFYAERAENATLWDVEGRAFTDFAAGIAVLNTGHRHPAVVRAVAEQLQRFTHTCLQVVPYEIAVSLAERLNAAIPIDGPCKTAFFTTGAEAVENAVKFARAFTGRSAVISFTGGFHGRTLMGMALTGKVAPYKVGFGPLPPEVFHIPFPAGARSDEVDASLAALQDLFKSTVEATRVAAIILEPVQGEGGFRVAPPLLMEGLRNLCDRHGILLIADEIQTGFARTGRMFAMEHYAVRPDLMTLAKSLSGGLPLSAVCGRAEVMEAAAPGGIGGTYAANPLAVAAAHAVLDVLRDEQLADRANVLGTRLRERLGALRAKATCITDVRGVGAMNAVEFHDPMTGEPSAAIAQRVQRRAMQDGLILLTCGQYGNVIRFLHPLTIPDIQFSQALDIIEQAVLSTLTDSEAERR